MKVLFASLCCLLIIPIGVCSQKVVYQVYAIKFAGSAYPSSTADWAVGGPSTDRVKIDFMVWLVKGSNGRNILVDAGFLNDIENAAEFKVVDYVRPDTALLKFGITPSAITDVILSHPHWDHLDGLGLFPNAHVWIQKEDFNYFVGGAWQKGGDHGGFAKRDVQLLVNLNLAGKLTLVEGDDKELMPGIKVFTGSRHTFNSQFVLVQTGVNNIVIASDNVWIYYNLEHLAPAANGTLDPAGYIKAMQRMKTLVSDNRYIIPGHDARVFSQFPMITAGVAEIK